jgi:hypothetical protein
MVIEISTDSDVWQKVKHALRSAGYRYFLQMDLFDSNRSALFLEPIVEPEGGKLSHGFTVYPGGCENGSHSEQLPDGLLNYDVFNPNPPFIIQERPAAKSSTNVLNASVCQTCGCKLDGKSLTRPCSCRCHVVGPV